MNKKLEENTDAELFDMLREEAQTAERAFAELYARLSPRIYAYCRRFVGNSDDANDIFQETFIRFYQSAKKEKLMTNVPAYALRIARNLCVNSKRREKQDMQYEDYMAFTRDAKYENTELLELIKNALDELPEEYREVFILREYDGLCYADIAEITGDTLATVKVRIYRAKQKIRSILSPYLDELSKL